jgi:hypothetical protein
MAVLLVVCVIFVGLVAWAGISAVENNTIASAAPSATSTCT